MFCLLLCCIQWLKNRWWPLDYVTPVDVQNSNKYHQTNILHYQVTCSELCLKIQSSKKIKAFENNSTNYVYKNAFQNVWGGLWLYIGLFFRNNNFTTQYRGLLARTITLHRKTPGTEEYSASMFPIFSFLSMWDQILKGSSFFIERDTLVNQSNLLCSWEEKGNTFIHSLMCPFTSPSSLSLCKHRGLEKSIKVYLNEEGQDTIAPSERWVVIREVDEESSSSTHSPVDETRLWTSACADTAGQGNEWNGSTAGAINSPISHQHCSHRCFINILSFSSPCFVHTVCPCHNSHCLL